MKTPRFLIGLALLFWGWQTDLLFWSAAMAAVLEGSRWAKTRWELTDVDLGRISDLGVVIFAVASLWLYSTMENRVVFVFKMMQWLPLCFFPIMVAQVYGSREKLPLSVFWWLLRRQTHRNTGRRAYNISYCYFTVCLVAASASTQLSAYFYPGLALLVILGLASVRPRRVSLAVWLILLVATVNFGVLGYQGLKIAQETTERALAGLLAGLFSTTQDAHERQTRIGSVGPIKESGRIILRVRPSAGSLVPTLLRDASWDVYKKQIWLASNSDLAIIHTGSSDAVKLLSSNRFSSSVEISRYYDNGAGLLELPQGTFAIADLPATEVRTNRLGMVRMDGGPGLVDMVASFGPEKSIDGPPTDRDLLVPEDEQPVMSNVLAGIITKHMSDRQKIRAISMYFQQNHFKYSLDPVPRGAHPVKTTWLGYFLNESRIGHCEYFATATVMLLRQAGIPARYATGYAVQELSKHGDTYLVRARDAHAWALVYHRENKYWDEVDNTPGNRDQADGMQPPWWEPISDTLSNLYYDFSKWRWSKTSYARYSMWLMVPLILYLVLRIVFSQRRRRTGVKRPDDEPDELWPGLDSELFLINRRLAALQLSRLPHESLQVWQRRLEQALPPSERLPRIFQLHRALRFDPAGLRSEDRALLRQEADQWLAEFSASLRAKADPTQSAS